MIKVQVDLPPRDACVMGSALDVMHRFRVAPVPAPGYVMMTYVHMKLLAVYGKRMVSPLRFVQLVDLMHTLGYVESQYDEDHTRYIRLTARGQVEAGKVAALLETLKDLL